MNRVILFLFTSLLILIGFTIFNQQSYMLEATFTCLLAAMYLRDFGTQDD